MINLKEIQQSFKNKTMINLREIQQSLHYHNGK